MAAVSPAAGAGPVVVMRLDGSIQPGSLKYLRRGIAEAERRGAELLVLELDTPGGLVTSLRDMSSAITGAGPPVAVYVSPPGARAASAGFFLLLAADVAAMAPGTNTGAAHPVSLGGGQKEEGGKPSPALDKALNDVAALARALAVSRGRPVELAEQAVRQSRSFSATEARQAGLVDHVVPTRDELLRALDGRPVRRFDGAERRLALASPRVEVVGPTAGERLLMTIADPQIAFLLLMVGMGGLMTEIFNPGLIVPGAVGAVALLLGLYALSALPVSVVGVALLLMAVAFFVAEAFVTSFGLLALAGVACFVVGALMLFEAGMRLSVAFVLPIAIVVGGAALLLATRALRARRRPAASGVQALIGLRGEAVTPLSPSGTVLVSGEYWEAVAPGPLVAGTPVRVVGASGRCLQVQEDNRADVDPGAAPTREGG